jgi:hypothetical protein
MPVWKSDPVAPQNAGMVLGGNAQGRQQWLDMSTATLITVTIATISSPQPAGPIAVSGTVAPTGSAVECAVLRNGVLGSFTAMTVTGTTWSGNITAAAGTPLYIRARATEEPGQYVDSNAFTAT